jgi:hypothetical protein
MADDRRVAIAALAVTALVGFTAPIVSCQSTRQAQRDAARASLEAQRAASRAELVREERRDLRAALSGAGELLQRSVDAGSDLAVQVQLGVGNPPAEILEDILAWPDTSRSVDLITRRLNRIGGQMRLARQRLLIRLGPKSDVFRVYDDAVDQTILLTLILPQLRSGKDPTKNLRALQDDQRDFQAAAYELAGSILE